MKELFTQLRELRRLMRRTQISAADALGLLIDQLKVFEEVQRIEDELQHAEYPRHVYGR